MIIIYTLLAYFIFPAVAIFVRLNYESGLKSGFVAVWIVILGLVDIFKVYAVLKLFL